MRSLCSIPFPHFYGDLPFPLLPSSLFFLLQILFPTVSPHCRIVLVIFESSQGLDCFSPSRLCHTVQSVLHSVCDAVPCWSFALFSGWYLALLGFSCFQVCQTHYASLCFHPYRCCYCASLAALSLSPLTCILWFWGILCHLTC